MAADTLAALRRLAEPESAKQDADSSAQSTTEKRRAEKEKAQQFERDEIAAVMAEFHNARQDGIASCLNFMLDRMRKMELIQCVKQFCRNFHQRLFQEVEIDTVVVHTTNDPRQSAEWRAANEAAKRLRQNPHHGIVVPSALGGTAGKSFSTAKRDSPVVGDLGNSEAAHIEPGAYEGACPDLFAPYNMPNLYLSIVPRFGDVIGDQGNGDASHIEPGKYKISSQDMNKLKPFPINATLRSRSDRFVRIMGEPKEGEGRTNPKTDPGSFNLQKYGPFGDVHQPGSLEHPGVGHCVPISNTERWGTTG